MQGRGLCLWRLGQWDEAARAFSRMLWMNPPDNQGIRFLLPAVRTGKRWRMRRGQATSSGQAENRPDADEPPQPLWLHSPKAVPRAE